MNIPRLAAIVAVTAMSFAACGNSDTAGPVKSNAPTEVVKPPLPRAITIVVKNLENPHRFEPRTLDLKKGETYEIKLVGGGEYHTFTVNDFGINQLVEPGKTVSVVFKAEKSGTFDLQCIPHFTQGMVGKIIVK